MIVSAFPSSPDLLATPIPESRAVSFGLRRAAASAPDLPLLTADAFDREPVHRPVDPVSPRDLDCVLRYARREPDSWRRVGSRAFLMRLSRKGLTLETATAAELAAFRRALAKPAEPPASRDERERLFKGAEDLYRSARSTTGGGAARTRATRGSLRSRTLGAFLAALCVPRAQA